MEEPIPGQNLEENWKAYLKASNDAQAFSRQVNEFGLIDKNELVQGSSQGVRFKYSPTFNPLYGARQNNIQNVPELLSQEMDPAFHYNKYAAALDVGNAYESDFKQQMNLANRFPQGTIDREYALARARSHAGTAASYWDVAEKAKQKSIDLSIAEQRQKQIENLRTNNDLLHRLATNVEDSAKSVREKGTIGSHQELQRDMILWDEALKRYGVPFANKMGYLLEGVGTTAMAGDVARLVGGGGVGTDEQGNPAIRSKAEMRSQMPIPEEFQNSYREETPDEIKAKEAKWAAEDAREKNKAELLKMVTEKRIAKEARNRLEESKTVEGNILNSPFWNKSK